MCQYRLSCVLVRDTHARCKSLHYETVAILSENELLFVRLSYDVVPILLNQIAEIIP